MGYQGSNLNALSTVLLLDPKIRGFESLGMLGIFPAWGSGVLCPFCRAGNRGSGKWSKLPGVSGLGSDFWAYVPRWTGLRGGTW